MSVNRQRAHILVVPEDDATYRIVNGFLNHSHLSRSAVLLEKPLGGGRTKIFPRIQDLADHLKLRHYPLGHVVVVADGDCDPHARLEGFKNEIPGDLETRISIIVYKGDADAIKSKLGVPGFAQKLGDSLASDCLNNCSGLWQDSAFDSIRPDLPQIRSTVLPLITNQPIY